MQLSEVRINLCPPGAGRLKAFCSLTFDNTFVIRDVKLIEGNDGLFLAMPSRKLCDRCKRCSEKNHLRAKFCNNCGSRLDENRYLRLQPPQGGRVKLHADIAHPIHPECRTDIERQVLRAFEMEFEKSKLPGYVPQRLDHDLHDFEYDLQTEHPAMKLRPTGQEIRH